MGPYPPSNAAIKAILGKGCWVGPQERYEIIKDSGVLPIEAGGRATPRKACQQAGENNKCCVWLLTRQENSLSQAAERRTSRNPTVGRVMISTPGSCRF